MDFPDAVIWLHLPLLVRAPFAGTSAAAPLEHRLPQHPLAPFGRARRSTAPRRSASAASPPRAASAPGSLRTARAQARGEYRAVRNSPVPPQLLFPVVSSSFPYSTDMSTDPFQLPGPARSLVLSPGSASLVNSLHVPVGVLDTAVRQTPRIHPAAGCLSQSFVLRNHAALQTEFTDNQSL